MARKRNVNPDAPKDEDVASMTIWARYVWTHLPCHADREGRLKDSAFTLKMEILPADDVDMEAILAELAAKRHIIRYRSADGRKFLQIRSFSKHQTPHIREGASSIPAPAAGAAQAQPEASTVLALVKPAASTPDPDPIRSDPDLEQCLPVLAPDPEIPDDPIPVVPRTSTELLRLFEVFWVPRWSMPFVRKQWDPKTADALMEALPVGARREIRPAIQRYLADTNPKYLDVKHPFQLFARDFDAYRGPPASPPQPPGRRKIPELPYAR